VEPDVEALVRVVLPARQRHRDAPVDVPRHRPRPDVLQQVQRELEHVGPPVGTRTQPVAERPGQRRQVQEEVLGLDELGRLAVDPAARVDQIDRVQLVAAVVALVTAGAVVAADRAGAFDIAVRQRPPGGRGDRALLRLLDHVAVVVDRLEQLLRHRVVVPGGGAGEQVVGQAEIVQVLDDHAVVAVGQLARRRALLLGLDQDRRAVLVGAGNHEHVVAGHPHVPAEHVGGHSKAGHMTDVARAVGIRPGNRGENVTHEGKAYRGPIGRREWILSSRHAAQVRGEIGTAVSNWIVTAEYPITAPDDRPSTGDNTRVSAPDLPEAAVDLLAEKADGAARPWPPPGPDTAWWRDDGAAPPFTPSSPLLRPPARARAAGATASRVAAEAPGVISTAPASNVHQAGPHPALRRRGAEADSGSAPETGVGIIEAEIGDNDQPAIEAAPARRSSNVGPEGFPPPRMRAARRTGTALAPAAP